MRFYTSVEDLLRWKGYQFPKSKLRPCRVCGGATVSQLRDTCSTCFLWACAEIAVLAAAERKDS